MSEAKVRLGRHLFYDTRLFGNATFSCASCHQQPLAFQSPRLKGFEATPRDIADRVAFLRSLTDDEFLRNPAFGTPSR